MTEDTNQESPSEEKSPVKTQTRRKKSGPDKDGNYTGKSYRVMLTTKSVGTLFDNSRNVRIVKTHDVPVDGPIPAGSWLGCQIAAGLVQVVE